METEGFEYLSIRFWNGSGDFEPCFYPYCVEEAERRLPKAFGTRGQNFLIVALLLSGELEYVFERCRIPLRPGGVLLIPPGTPYCFGVSGKRTGYRKLVLEICGRNLEEELRERNLLQVVHREIRNPAELTERIRKIGTLLEDTVSHEAELIGRTVEILCSFRGPFRKAHSAAVESAQREMEKKLADPIDLGSLAAELRIGRSTLGRLFRTELGLSPREYWIRRKIRRAQEYLVNTDFSIKEISVQLGYSSQFHFSGEFRKRCGLSPSEFRKKEKIRQEKPERRGKIRKN